MMERLAIVVPCYNEEEVLSDTVGQLTDWLVGLTQKGKISSDSYLLLVNDGSTDNTWAVMRELFAGNPRVCALCLAGNVGQQNALMAGFAAVDGHCDIAVSIDADLQDDIGVMEEMIDLFHGGAEVVYGVRKERKTDTFFKRATAELFYQVMARLGTKTVYNHAEYRLMSAKALRQLLCYRERNLFIRGLVPLMGCRSETVYYSRKSRTEGKSKYPPVKMLATALEGITSFSTEPITMLMVLGAVMMVGTLIALAVILTAYGADRPISGRSWVMASVCFLGGLQLMAIGVIGQYIGCTYLEVKRRPRYHIECFLRHDESCKEKDT